MTSLLRTWVSADPAADLAVLLAVGLLSVLLAADAARLPVDSDRVFFGMVLFPFVFELGERSFIGVLAI